MSRIATALNEIQARHDFKEVIDVEGIDSIFDFFGMIVTAMKSPFEWLENEEKSASLVTPTSFSPYAARAKHLGFSTLARNQAFMPPYCKTDMETYVSLLYKQAAQMRDIEQRLYKPIATRMEQINAMDNLHNKPWNDRNMEFADVERMKKDFLRINAQEDTDDDKKRVSEHRELAKVYSSFNTMEKVDKLLDKTSEAIKSVNLKNLKSLEAEILKHSASFLEDLQSGHKEAMSKGAQKQFVQTLYALAQETEYMTVVMYNANVTIEAWNKTIEGIRKVL